MSINVGGVSVPILKALDSRLELGLPRLYNAIMGSKDNIGYQTTAQSFSNTAVNWSYTVPSLQSIVNRKVYVKPYFRITVGADPLRPGVDGLRQCPLTSCTTNLNVQFNGASISIEPQDIIHALVAVGGTMELRNHYYSTFPGWNDQYWDLASIDAQAATVRNVNGVYGQTLENTRNVANYYDPEQTNTATDYYLTWAEPLFISPFLWSERNEVGLTQLQTLEIKYSLGGGADPVPLARLLEIPNGGPGNVPVVQAVAHYRAPELLLQVFSLHADEDIPRTLNYPYYQVTRYAQPELTVLPGATATLTTNTITMSSIPHRMMIYARRSLNTSTANTSDCFGSIENVSITYKSRNGVLQTFNKFQLYQMSVNNGLDMSWVQYNEYTGGPCVFEFGSDIPLDWNEATGLNGRFNLQVRFTFRNINNKARPGPTPQLPVTFTPMLLTIEEGMLTAENSVFRTVVGPIVSVRDIEVAEWSVGAYESLRPPLYGGSWSSFWNRTKQIVGKIARVVGNVAPVVGKIAGAVGSVVPHPMVKGIAGAVQQGADVAGRVAKNISGEGRPRRRSVSRSGGRRLSRSQLAMRARH